MSSTFLRTGWTVCAGLEYAISKNWSDRFEYDYLGFGSQSLNFTTPITPSYNLESRPQRPGNQAGLDFRFGGP